MHGNDTKKQIFFYEQEFYPFSNFSSFKLDFLNKAFNKRTFELELGILLVWKNFHHMKMKTPKSLSVIS